MLLTVVLVCSMSIPVFAAQDEKENNVTVKYVTTVDGAFVTHLYSEGGQAVWDCTTINGDRVAPGIYLVFITDESGKETFATKILIM